MRSKDWRTLRLKKWQNGFGKNWSHNAPAFARSSCTKHRPRAAFTAANNLARTSRNNSGFKSQLLCQLFSVRFLTARWRSASSCCRGWGAECREVRQLFSCCRGTLRVPGEWRFARRHRDFVRRCAVTRRARFVAAQGAIVFPRGALLRRSNPVAPTRRRIQLRFAIREHFPAMNNQAAFEMHPVKCPAPVCRVVEKIVSRIARSAGGCPLYVSGAAALQFGKCLAGSTNRSAVDSPRAPAESADWSTRSRGSLLSLFACCQAADTRVPGARAKSASADLPAYPISRPGKACRRLPLRSFRENRASLL